LLKIIADEKETRLPIDARTSLIVLAAQLQALLTAIRRRERAPSTTSEPEWPLTPLMSASTSCGHTSASGYLGKMHKD
jgi:hypothetical protein